MRGFLDDNRQTGVRIFWVEVLGRSIQRSLPDAGLSMELAAPENFGERGDHCDHVFPERFERSFIPASVSLWRTWAPGVVFSTLTITRMKIGNQSSSCQYHREP